jgi:hypothetical protein
LKDSVDVSNLKAKPLPHTPPPNTQTYAAHEITWALARMVAREREREREREIER